MQMKNIIPLTTDAVWRTAKMTGSTIHFVFSAKRHKCLTQGWALRYSGLWFTLSRVVADMSDDPGCILSAFWSVILEASNHCARGWIHFYTRPNILHLLYAPCILTLMPKSCGHVFAWQLKRGCNEKQMCLRSQRAPRRWKILVVRDILPKMHQ